MKYNKAIIVPFEIRQEEKVFQDSVKEINDLVIEVIKNDYKSFEKNEIILDEYLERVIETKELKDITDEIVVTKNMIFKK